MRGKILLAASLATVMRGAALAADVHVGINIGVPPPPIVVAEPPRLVIVPRTPVYYAPSLPANYFYYDGGYYTVHEGSWFYATSYNGPWTFVSVQRVPRPVLAVPVAYYKVPPGHWKHHGPPPWAGREKEHEREHGGHGRGHHKHDDD